MLLSAAPDQMSSFTENLLQRTRSVYDDALFIFAAVVKDCRQFSTDSRLVMFQKLRKQYIHSYFQDISDVNERFQTGALLTVLYQRYVRR